MAPKTATKRLRSWNCWNPSRVAHNVESKRGKPRANNPLDIIGV